MKGHRVLILVENHSLPFDRRVWLEAKTLTTAGYHVSIICPRGKGPADDSYAEVEGVRIYRYRAWPGRGAPALKFAWAWLRTFLLTIKVYLRDGFDVIHACNPPDSFFLIALIFRPFRKRFVFDQHHLCPEVYLSKFPHRAGSLAHRLLLWGERLSYRAAHAVISLKESHRETALSRGVPADRVFVVRSEAEPGERLAWEHSAPLLVRAYEKALDGVPPRRLRIYMVGQKGIPATYGGIERHVEEVGARLALRGHEVTVYCRPHYSRLKRDYRGMRLVHRPSVNTKHLDTLTHTFLCTLDVFFRRADIVHYHALGPSPFAIFPRLRGVLTLVTVHGLDWEREKWGPLASYILERCEYPAIHFPNATIAVSRTLQQYFAAKYQIEPRFIPNGTPDPVQRAPEKIREWGLKPGNYILFVGRLTPEKGCHYLLEAYSRLATDLKLVVAGGTSFTDEYVDSLKSYESDRVLMTGYVYGDVLAELWTNAFFVVLPSTMEGLSIALLEAVSYGKCVLISDIPENVEVMGDCAPRFESRNVDDLERKLRQLLETPGLVEKYMSLTRERIARRYAWETIVDDLEKCYFEVAAGRAITRTTHDRPAAEKGGMLMPDGTMPEGTR